MTKRVEWRENMPIKGNSRKNVPMRQTSITTVALRENRQTGTGDDDYQFTSVDSDCMRESAA
jgi:hypothetical protein